MDANELRAAFTRFFHERGHTVVPSASLIPHDPSVLFTIAGMVPFKPFFVGHETAPYGRATSVQKCFRTPDIEIVGTDTYHCTFFEMLGNFSFGDYFKTDAIPMAWELLTDVFGLAPERLWVTVHETDDEAEQIWIEKVGFPAERIQRMGDEDNWWGMGDTGPCGPDSEIFYDKGPEYGRDGGPKFGSDTRFVEIWNLVFMQFDQQADGSRIELPHKNIDTGAGLERILPILQGYDSIFDTDLFLPIITAAATACGVIYGSDERHDVSLRVMADHARAASMLVADGVLPANEGRGYVLRRVVRRAVLAARRLGFEAPITPVLVDAVQRVLGLAWPALIENHDVIVGVLSREEAGFDRTLRAGLGRLEEAFATGAEVLSGDVAFTLHDTHGFPVELTEELARDAGLTVDRAGFDAAMAEQRERARSATRANKVGDAASHRAILDQEGPTQFMGRSTSHYEIPARIVGVLAGSEPDEVEVFLDQTPFYAEQGGQVGDIGTIATETGTAAVYDTVYALPGLILHKAKLTGSIEPGQDAVASIDVARRMAIRRNHTATHLLHAALRKVLGDHVRQQGSEVSPERLRFDFSHHGQPSREELDAVFALANAAVLTDEPVETTETSRDDAERMGAIAFFGDKYGASVRVVQAGTQSLEFCGGTHVDALGQIGPIFLVSEASIGSNTRRLFAVTGQVALDRANEREQLVHSAAELLRTEPDDVVGAVERLMARQRESDKELSKLKQQSSASDATDLAAAAVNGVLVVRRDGLDAKSMQSLAKAVRAAGPTSVLLIGSPDGKSVAIVGATGPDGPSAKAVVGAVAGIVGGGGGGSDEFATAGGKEPAHIDDALAEARRLLSE